MSIVLLAFENIFRHLTLAHLQVSRLYAIGQESRTKVPCSSDIRLRLYG
jgi:hypothetical protein